MNSEIKFNERGMREKPIDTEPYRKGNLQFCASSIFFVEQVNPFSKFLIKVLELDECPKHVQE